MSEYPSISADGSKVAFSSNASNFFPGAQAPQIYVRNLAAGTTTLVSRGNGAGAPDNGYPADAVISGDGNSVAFDSWADNLVAGDSNVASDVFVRNIAANTTTLISRRSGAAGALGDDYSYDPSISADGTKVAFDSYADNLVNADTNKSQDVFVRDLRIGSTTLVSRAANGGPTDAYSDWPALSANGNCVAFQSGAGNVTPTAPRSDFTRIFMATISRECPVDPPDTKIASAPPALGKSRTAAFGFASNDPAASFQCSLDGSAFAACARAYQTPPLADGKHSLAVRALDPAGYADASPAGASWTIDATPPLLRVSVPKQRLGAVRAKGLRLTVSCSEPCSIRARLFRGTRLIGTVSAKLPAASKQAVRIKLIRKAKRSLAHSRSVRLKLRTSATDLAGNVSQSSRSLKLRR
jgi:hypothetical protein